MKIKKMAWVFILFALPILSYAQKDVTQFLGIPVDGNKTQMINKLKSKGFTTNQHSHEVLDGEFNGTNVNLFIATNNNKVWRIAVVDVNSTDETNIKIRFNNLIQQFVNNKKYSKLTDSTIAKYTIPEDEDISYNIKVKNKRYEAVFYQESLKKDSLIKDYYELLTKDTLDNTDKERLKNIISESTEEMLNGLNKQVWFMIKENNGNYRIAIFYENRYNKDNGDDL